MGLQKNFSTSHKNCQLALEISERVKLFILPAEGQELKGSCKSLMKAITAGLE